jgi:hypothetical protein
MTAGNGLDPLAAADAAWARATKGKTAEAPVSLEDFYAYLPAHNYIFEPTRAHWPAVSVNARIPPIKLINKRGAPVLDKNGKQVVLSASAWLDKYRAVEQMTWAPGLELVIRDRLIYEGGWIDRPGARCFNQYLAPEVSLGDPARADRWLEHVRFVYPDEADHLLDWFAHRVQHPEEKVNHALILGGAQGIGKDTILEPLKHAIGPWNFQETSPIQVLGRFNTFLKSVILRISEARDLGDSDRFKFYDHLKSYAAAPPDTLRIDQKHVQEYSILNCCGIVITTNHKADGIYLPADDRRHVVAWSDRTKEDPRFQGTYWSDLWAYYESGGLQHIAAYLRKRDIRDFNPKAPPPKTPAFWAIVDANRPPEEAELGDLLDKLGEPDAITLRQLQSIAKETDGEVEKWLKERANRRVIPHRLERCGYAPVRNPDSPADGDWRIGGRRQVVYAKKTLSVKDQIDAARALARR